MSYSKLHVCVKCGSDYWGRCNTSTLCAECREELASIKRAIKSVKVCLYCGKNFSGTPQKKYCSLGCVASAGKDRAKDKVVVGYAKLRWLVILRDGFRCQYCGRRPSLHDVVLHVDHIKPKSKGGEDCEQNLITSCDDCNLGKFDTSCADEIMLHFGEKDMRVYEKSIQEAKIDRSEEKGS